MAVRRKIAVIGLGYVGLPVAVSFAERGYSTIGFEISKGRVEELKAGRDRTNEVSAGRLKGSGLNITSDPAALGAADFFIVTVPTPIDSANAPDLSAVRSASRLVGGALKKGDIVVYESTVYPGCTEDDCAPILEAASGLRSGVDFFLGYSPERINPGDHAHRFETIKKVVSGQTPEVAKIVAETYGAVVEAGVHLAPSIKVAEAAKVIENTQRDLNIALMNELAIIFERMGIRTKDVLAAAGTKWNFLRFSPGLVGGHCIGVDPYYLTMKAQQLGYQPEVILAGRRINNSVSVFVAQRLIKMLVRADLPAKGAKIGVLGLTFKEDVSDVRNSKVPDIVRELEQWGADVLVHDPMASAAEAKHEYGLDLSPIDELRDLDGLVLAVSHRHYQELGPANLCAMLKPRGALVDVKSQLDPATLRGDVSYWSL